MCVTLEIKGEGYEDVADNGGDDTDEGVPFSCSQSRAATGGRDGESAGCKVRGCPSVGWMAHARDGLGGSEHLSVRIDLMVEGQLSVHELQERIGAIFSISGLWFEEGKLTERVGRETTSIQQSWS